MALLVEMFVIRPVMGSILFGRNDGNRSLFKNQLEKGVGIVAFVSQDIVTANAIEQVGRLRTVMALPRGKDKVEGVSQGIHNDMNLGAKAAATPA